MVGVFPKGVSLGRSSREGSREGLKIGGPSEFSYGLDLILDPLEVRRR